MATGFQRAGADLPAVARPQNQHRPSVLRRTAGSVGRGSEIGRAGSSTLYGKSVRGDMNAIPDDLVGFDFCWSACALEHLGSLRHGLDFIGNSLKCPKPGGVAVHAIEFNLGSDLRTLERGQSVVYRERDVIGFAQHLRHATTLNLHPGTEPTDRMVDRDYDSDIHLRLYVRKKALATSVGLTIRKAG
jgi:hypothetical protein